MSYKTILMHVGEPPAIRRCAAIAAQIAMAQESHVIGMASTGIERLLYETAALAELMPNFELDTESLRQHTTARLRDFTTAMDREGITTYETRRIDEDGEVGLVLHARYADLTIFSPQRHDASSPLMHRDFVDYVLLKSPCPMLMVPGEADCVLGGHVVVAWDGSGPAKSAMVAALPLLRLADLVHVVIVNAWHYPAVHGEVPGADISLYLARHGIRVESREVRSVEDPGHTLLAICSELKARLLVMGCYGHSALRETIVGGPTKTVIQAAEAPVLTAH